MSQQDSVGLGLSGDPELSASRTDKVTAALVRKAVTLQQIHGTKYAAEYLLERGIDIDVIRRVLLSVLGQRRHDDRGTSLIAAVGIMPEDF